MAALRRAFTLLVVLALMLVPAVGRARQRISPPNAKRLSAPYRSVDVKPAPALAAPDTQASVRVEPPRPAPYIDTAEISIPPVTPPDLADRGVLRGPPLV
jgi:hypothetical protein